MRRTVLGAIDAGSHALRVVVAELTDTGLRRLAADRVPVRLGHGAFTRGGIDGKTLTQAVAAFSGFRELFDRHGVEVYRAVGTSALRDAQNRDALLHRIYHEAAIELEVIDGEQEARLVRKAVVHAFGATAAPRCILDLGGGSLEVNLRTGARWRGYTLPVGTVRLMETLELGEKLSDAEAGMVRRATSASIKSVLPRAATDLGIAAVCGGNADALAKICGGSDGGMPAFDLAAVEKVLPELTSASVKDRMDRYAIRRDRAEVLGVAAVLLGTVARQLGITRMVAPGVGIREGILLELAEAATEEKVRIEGAHDKALLTAARTFAARVDHDTTHGEHVRTLARSLFLQLRDLHELPDESLIVLEVAALLHDIGEVVHSKGHHKHSEYLIRWGRIPGLDDDKRALVALLARCHRKSASDVRRILGDADLPKERRLHARRLTALLRLADGLDCEHGQRVQGVVVSRAGGNLVLDLSVREPAGKDETRLLRKSDLFGEEWKLPLKVTIAVVADPGEAVADDAAAPAAPESR